MTHSTSVDPLPVSVIIPAFERARLLPRALESVYAQRPQPAEVIVVDDGSRDRTAAVAERLGARVLRHEQNRGAAAARNTALRAAAHTWFAPLDSDDEWLPGHLATLWRLRGGHALVAGSAVQVGGPRYFLHGLPHERRERTLTGPGAILVPYNPIPASAVLARTDVALEVGGYREALRFAEDWDLWLRMLERGSAVQTPIIVSRYHLHSQQKSKSGDGPSRAQRAIVHSCLERGAISHRVVRMRRGVVTWERLRLAYRERRSARAARLAADLARDPLGLIGAARLVILRARLRRRANRVDADGLAFRALNAASPGGGETSRRANRIPFRPRALKGLLAAHSAEISRRHVPRLVSRVAGARVRGAGPRDGGV